MSDNTGAIAETMDYYAFGATRLDTKPAGSTLAEQRKYIGQEFDQDTGLNYLNARYYNSAIGRFNSEDPMFWGSQNLSDPQSLNSYSYANNNPVRYSDPSGTLAQELAMSGLGLEGAGLGLDATFFGAPVGVLMQGAGLVFLGAGAAVGGYEAVKYYRNKAFKEETINSLAGQNGETPTPNKNTPKLIKVGIATLIAVGTYVEKMQDINDTVNNAKDYLIKINGMNSGKQVQNSQIKNITQTQTNSQQSSNQTTYNASQSYSYSASQTAVFQQQLSIMQTIVSLLQSQINQLKANYNK